MSMMCRVLGLSSAQIGALRATPTLPTDLAGVSQSDLMMARLDEAMARMPPERRAAAEASFRASLDATPAMREARARIAEARARIAGIGPFEQPLSLEKSWHMIHYLATGHTDASDAPGNELLTGEPLGEDAGYGPARLHDEIATRNFARFLETLDLAHMLERVNLRVMNDVGVYGMPMGPGSDPQYEGGLRMEVAHYFPLLRDYVVKMSEKQNGLLIWIS